MREDDTSISLVSLRLPSLLNTLWLRPKRFTPGWGATRVAWVRGTRCYCREVVRVGAGAAIVIAATEISIASCPVIS